MLRPVALLIAATLFASCRPHEAASAGSHTDSAAASRGDTVPVAHAGSASFDSLEHGAAPIIRALYVNRWASQNPAKMRRLIAMADSTEINALVIDVKDEFGLNIATRDTLMERNAGHSGVIADLPRLIDTLRAHGILPIARIVVFKDSVAARANPNHIIRKPDGTPWRDKKGITWVNPYDKQIWEYNFRVADEALKLGFGEIQFDYIRFPEPFKSLPPQVFPGASQPKPQVLADFLRAAKARVAKQNVRITADIFGLVASIGGPLEVGQEWSKLAPVTDVLLPMTYPSHYPPGSFGIAHPNADPYHVVLNAIAGARAKDDQLGITGEHVRPWVQAFNLGHPPYGPNEVKAQIHAIYDAGYDGWVLWNPGSNYEPFLPAFEKQLASHKRAQPITRTQAAHAALPAGIQPTVGGAVPVPAGSLSPTAPTPNATRDTSSLPKDSAARPR